MPRGCIVLDRIRSSVARNQRAASQNTHTHNHRRRTVHPLVYPVWSIFVYMRAVSIAGVWHNDFGALAWCTIYAFRAHVCLCTSSAYITRCYPRKLPNICTYTNRKNSRRTNKTDILKHTTPEGKPRTQSDSTKLDFDHGFMAR